MGVLGGECADVELACGWGMGMVARGYYCLCGLGGGEGYTVFVVCWSVGGVGIVGVGEIREVGIIRWWSGQ